MSRIAEAAAAFVAALAAGDLDGLTDPERIDELTAATAAEPVAI